MLRRKAPRIPDELLDHLLAGADPKTAFDTDGLLDELLPWNWSPVASALRAEAA